jgi:pimeloyl-ACP methyl ester carboxylesterase
VAADVQDSFDEFAAWCARTAGCALHGRDVRAVWADLLARADDPFFLVDLAEQGLRGPWWAELAQVLADQAGDAARPVAADAGEVPYPQVAIFCADYDLPVRDHAELAAHLRRAAEVAPNMRYGTFGVYGTVVCLGAPKPVANPQHRLDVRGVATPLLLVNARHDPATGHAWAANVARQLGGAGVLLTYEGWGHIVYGRGACVDEAVDRYLFTRVPPAPGTTCPPAGG